jgi:hypothetical protein
VNGSAAPTCPLDYLDFFGLISRHAAQKIGCAVGCQTLQTFQQRRKNHEGSGREPLVKGPSFADGAHDA